MLTEKEIDKFLFDWRGEAGAYLPIRGIIKWAYDRACDDCARESRKYFALDGDEEHMPSEACLELKHK